MKRKIPRQIHLWKNVRKEVIGLKNLLKRVKFQTLHFNFSRKNKSTQASKIQQAKRTRDIFGRLLFLAITKQIGRIFTYPLVPETSCFCHPDGSLRDSLKSKGSSIERFSSIRYSTKYWNRDCRRDFSDKIDTPLSYLQVVCPNSFEDCLKTV